jgi:hypothetical protein
MCTIRIFIAKILLQFQIKQEFHGDLAPLDPLPELYPGPTGDLGPEPQESAENKYLGHRMLFNSKINAVIEEKR